MAVGYGGLMDNYLSLMVICGDSGVKTLGRMLKSILVRADGPMVDEVVIGWNGTGGDQHLRDAIYEVDKNAHSLDLGADAGATVILNSAGTRTTVVRQIWRNDFAWARNDVMQRCKGEWILWADSDDIICSTADPEGLKAIEACERSLGVEPSTGNGGSGGQTLKDWLKRLPWNVTCVRAPYDYHIDANGNADVRQFRRRVLKRDCYSWRLPIHELAYPFPGIIESAAETGGLLLRHYPSEESAAKLQRNKAVLDMMQERKGSPDDQSKPVDFADARHAFDVASMNIGLGDLAAADYAIRVAISRSGVDTDTYRYRLTRSLIALQRGQNEAAYAEAVAAAGLKPEMQDAWFMAAECQYLAGKWASCITFYELGASKKPAAQAVDYVISREVKPRAQAAVAFCELGTPEKGLQLAEEAVRMYPNDDLAVKTYKRVTYEIAKRKGLDGALDAVELLLQSREVEAAEAVLDAAKNAVSLRGITWIPRYQELRALAKAKAWLKRDRLKGDPADLSLPSHWENSEVVYYDTKTGAPEDTEGLVDFWSSNNTGEYQNQVLQVVSASDGLAVRVRKTAKPRLTFYAPHAISQWDPTTPEKSGVGGSESAVVYLSRELAKRGYPITVYCPTGAVVGCDMGFVWRGLSYFNTRADHGILIACRAPWILRNPDLKSPTFVWHQDNGYGSDWHWNAELDKRSKGSLHVSSWAQTGLIRELVTAQSRNPDPGQQHWKDALGRDPFRTHRVIGNGVEENWCLVSGTPSTGRHPHRVIYASDPTRGLDTLLNCWPYVREAVPDAELHVYGDLITGQAFNMVSGTSWELAFVAMKKKLHNTEGVVYKSRVGQIELSKAMAEASVYAYPGGMMPEGYGIALAQAAAAGCAVVFPAEGALPDIHDTSYMVPPIRSEELAKKFLDQLIAAVKNTEHDRVGYSRRIQAEHTWGRVADRFEQALGELC